MSVFPVPLLSLSMLTLPAAAEWTHPDEVAVYARACFTALGLVGWDFHWDHAVKRMGCCWPTRRRISLSRYYAAACLPQDAARLRRTLLHELAHALAWHHERSTGHGPAWQRWCAELGIPGERATSRVPDFTPPHLQHAARYALCHDVTGEVFRQYRRKPQRSAAQLRRCYIPGRREETLGHLVIREIKPEEP